MKAGYAQTVITPSLERPVFLAGFGQDRRAESIHDDLFARALALSDGQTTLVLVAVDLIGFFRPDVSEVLQTLKVSEAFRVLDPQVVIASTHTHHGPDTMGLWGPDMKTRGVDEKYLADIKNKIASTIQSSLNSMQTVELKMASVHVPGLAKNARNPEIVDDELTVIQFVPPVEAGLGPVPTVATLMNFPCHPEVLWEHNPHITSDYPGYLRAEVEKQTGAPCVFFSGALGGMMTPDVKDHSFEEAEFMGKKLASEGLKALSSLSPRERAEGEGEIPAISIQKKEITPKLTNLLYKIAFWRKLLPDVRDRSGRVHSEVNLIKIGDAWFASVPGELLPKLGLALKADLTRAGARVAGIIGLANDELGYILPFEDFKYPLNPFNPGKHYEETNSISKEVGPKIMEAIRSLL